jgi:hypothetical protein
MKKMPGYAGPSDYRPRRASVRARLRLRHSNTRWHLTFQVGQVMFGGFTRRRDQRRLLRQAGCTVVAELDDRELLRIAAALQPAADSGVRALVGRYRGLVWSCVHDTGAVLNRLRT